MPSASIRDERTVSLVNILRCSAAYCAFCMGAAFCSGQEVMQFFTSFGWQGMIGLFLAMLILIYTGWQVQRAAHTERWKNPSQAFTYFGGPWIGRFLSLLVTLSLAAEIAMMSASSGAIFAEHYGLPNPLGRGAVLLLVIITVLAGLNRIMDVLGFLGPVVGAVLILVGIVSILQADLTVAAGVKEIAYHDMLQGGSHWLLSGLKYPTYCLLTIVPIWVTCGERANSLKESNIASVTHILLFGSVMFIMLFAQFKNIPLIAGTQLPSLVMASYYMPLVGHGLSVIILVGIYSAEIMSLWFVVRSFAQEGTNRYRILTVGLALAAFFLSGLMPFDRIVNTLYSAVFVFGVFFLGLIFYKMMRRLIRKAPLAKTEP